MRSIKALSIFPALMMVFTTITAGPADPWLSLPTRAPHTDHSTFYKGPFKDGPSVTLACLECHPKAASEIMKTAHWNLVGDEVVVPGHDEPVRIGKRNLINNFCIGIKSNWPGCTSCHIGFGWTDDTFDLKDKSLIDCLVCHEQTGSYRKDAGDAGVPAPDVDLLAVAKSVALPRRSNCGACHFMGGGGNAVKHGDLDESLLFPNPEIDVHMGKLDFQCIDCHQAEDHLPPGRLLTVSVDDRNRLFCTDCHKGDEIHADRRIDAHDDKVACQTCHIPLMAKKLGTKMSWDWSQAGQDLSISDEHRYLKIKGRFTWVKGADPEYAWYNGSSNRYLLGDGIDAQAVTAIAAPLGNRNDPKAKIYPFKIHRGKQVYDTEYRYFLLPHVHGDKGFWTQFDWDLALRIGSEVSGLPFSGNYAFAATEMYLPQNHMVVAKEKALQCPDCHGESGRMDWAALGYEADPVFRETLEHEPIPLLDAEGEMVHESGNALSTAITCSQCHEIEDEAFLATHAYHSEVVDSDLLPGRRILMQQGPRVSHDEEQQMNCFLCHLVDPNIGAWLDATASGRRGWAVSATLIGTGMLEPRDEDYVWNPEILNEDELAVISMAYPRPAHCGNCHGLVAGNREPLAIQLGSDEHWGTETTGQVFSAQPMHLSALNLRNKDDLGRAWDVHAQRLVECQDCHYAKETPSRLSGSGDMTTLEAISDGLRTCRSCHTVIRGHDWLPEKEHHFSVVACESCHVPRIHLPARKQVDASMLTADGNFRISYRGLAQGAANDLGRAFIVGYQPLLLKHAASDGSHRWTPMNLMSRWYWTDAATGSAVDRETLRRALFSGDRYLPEVTELLDENADGQVSADELRLDNPEDAAVIAALLAKQGVDEPRLVAEIRAYHLHHSVALDDANRDCRVCHDETHTHTFNLADFVPAGVIPGRFHGVSASIGDLLRRNADGGLELTSPLPVSSSGTISGRRN